MGDFDILTLTLKINHESDNLQFSNTIVKSGNHAAILQKIQFSAELSVSPSKSLNCGKSC